MIGVDIIDKRRIARLWEKDGRAFAKKILHPQEQEQLEKEKNPARFLAMRWAAKEAFAKALQTGLRAPVVMPAFQIRKQKNGAPFFQFSSAINTLLTAKNISHVHLSLSDEKNLAVAMVMLERETKITP